MCELFAVGHRWELRSTGHNLVTLGHTIPLLGGYIWLQLEPKADQMSSWPYIVLVLATRCLYLTEGQPDPKADQMSSWPYVTALDTRWCLYWGLIWLKMQIFKPFWTLCPVKIDVFLFFWQGELSKQPKIYILLILTGKNALKWLEWCVYRIWGMPDPMALVLRLSDKWLLKNQNFRGKVA